MHQSISVAAESRASAAAVGRTVIVVALGTILKTRIGLREAWQPAKSSLPDAQTAARPA
jgi:hypothetical protein